MSRKPNIITIKSKPQKGRITSLELTPADAAMILDAFTYLPTTTETDLERKDRIMRIFEAATR